jgi:hypothetical protein
VDGQFSFIKSKIQFNYGNIFQRNHDASPSNSQCPVNYCRRVPRASLLQWLHHGHVLHRSRIHDRQWAAHSEAARGAFHPLLGGYLCVCRKRIRSPRGRERRGVRTGGLVGYDRKRHGSSTRSRDRFLWNLCQWVWIWPVRGVRCNGSWSYRYHLYRSAAKIAGEQSASSGNLLRDCTTTVKLGTTASVS